LFLPGFLRPAQSNFDGGRLTGLQVEEELGVLDPGERVRLLLELLVVEMAATGSAFLPLGGQHDVSAILQLLDFHGLRRIDYQTERAVSRF